MPKPTSPPPLSPMGQAALQYARRGWPVFPCREGDQVIGEVRGKPKVLKAKQPYGGAGFKDATTDEEVIKGWWQRNRNAMIGVPMGRNGMFALDFDPRVEEEIDPDTGEVTGVREWTLEQLKADLEAQMGVPLPASITSRTPSGGVHVWFRQPSDGGGPIRNRGNLPEHVDVRGDGGYVIGAPSHCEGGESATEGDYRWIGRRGDWRDDAAFMEAPAELIAILRAPKAKAVAQRPAPTLPAGPEDKLYAQAARLVISYEKTSTSWLQRQLRIGYNSAAQLIERMEREGIVGPPDHVGRRVLLTKTMPETEPSPSRAPAGDGPEAKAYAAIRKYGDSALLEECRAIRTAPSGRRNAQLNESALKVASLTVSTPFAALDAREARSMVEAAARDNPGNDDDGQLIATINSGWSAGEASPRDLIDVAERAARRAQRPPDRSSRSARPSPPPPPPDDYGEPSSREGASGDTGGRKGCGPGPRGAWGDELTRRCAMLPQTDLGNKERFLARYGANFLYVEAWGWLAWDGKRWNRDMAMALLGRAVQDTMRAIQGEADFVRASGVPFPPREGDIEIDSDDDRDEQDDEREPQFVHEWRKKKRKLKSANWYRQRELARSTGGEGPRDDAIVQVKSNGDIVLLSTKIAAWGRASEGAGHINCIATLAAADLAAKTDDFDSDPLALNVQNGTLQFVRASGEAKASVKLRPHAREDRMTKIARVTYEAGATSPIFDAFLARVQPNPEMREFLDRWSGYNALGLADAQKFSIFYGEGSNGKGVWVQTLAWLLGDYAWTTGIETFMDAGRKRNGGGPTTDLAALAGRRMVYANEPDDASRFSDGLLKSLTSDEPIGGVRELMKPPFELLVTWANTIMANTLPKIGTDWGTRRRVQVVPWEIIIPVEERDLQLKDKIRAELSGVLNRVVTGALAYLTDGLTMPEAMVEATQAYHDENDILAMFLDLCIARSPGDKLGATALHRLFTAWQTWAMQLPASGKAWSSKYLNAQMQKKGFKINKASTMQWHDIVPRFEEADFVDEYDGGKLRPTVRELPAPMHPDKPSAGAPATAPPEDRGAQSPPRTPDPDDCDGDFMPP